MKNAFQKLLKQELGCARYQNYMMEYQKMDQLRRKEGKKIQINGVFEDIYDSLKENESMTLMEKYTRLKETMTDVFHICRHYLFVMITYVCAALVIVFMGSNSFINLCCVAGLSVAFLYKTYEFAINKYSYLDAYLIIAYKAALEKRLKETKS